MRFLEGSFPGGEISPGEVSAWQIDRSKSLHKEVSSKTRGVDLEIQFDCGEPLSHYTFLLREECLLKHLAVDR